MNERNGNVLFFAALALVLLLGALLPPSPVYTTVGVFLGAFAVSLAACKQLGHIAGVPRTDGSQVCLQCYGPLEGSHDPGDRIPAEQPQSEATEDDMERARR